MKIKLLQSASSLRDLAILLGFKPKAISFLLYKVPKPYLYTQFQIPKKNGSTRTIMSPCAELKNLQSVISNYLQDCLEEIDEKRQKKGTLSHGFKRGYSIASNAAIHRNRRYLLNLDLEDFFGSINFGRVRGFFINDKNFSLHPDVATVLAQIICFENKLPQGSPCSPVVSNLIGHLLDIRLVGLASRYGCSYTRYADDISFSTNKKDFPAELAAPGSMPHEWHVGPVLTDVIMRTGFSINASKTRVQYSDSRQEVTGLVVNKKVNTAATYRRAARAMAERLFRTGSFQVEKMVLNSEGNSVSGVVRGSIDQLNGIFNFITMINRFSEVSRESIQKSELSSIEKVHRDLLFYKYFYANTMPTIICEGSTDNIYLRCAIRKLSANFPALAGVNEKGETELKVCLFKYSKLNARLLDLTGGTPPLRTFISEFANNAAKYKSRKSIFPVIVLIDNDKGAKIIYSLIKQLSGNASVIDGSQRHYHIAQGLWIVPTPKAVGVVESKIEDFFEDKVLEMELGGKHFNSENNDLSDNEYGKQYFAEHVVKANHKDISFDLFAPILSTISTLITDSINQANSARNRP
ncbi:retron Ec67 family RNA-directed DNA polymerase/endonuclease [Pseudomonas viridiflava]|uniref:retron Ec67 family RNA-directed DNA polymerase/endonuclease n=1 Tax=Pseudomonas viridiflava TaxID=33069 RepID=UPI0013CF2AB5|nr:retron Ec67 family RNA-directed DNA polymerase/endonuclease [Pseudomonas viridiflava]